MSRIFQKPSANRQCCCGIQRLSLSIKGYKNKLQCDLQDMDLVYSNPAFLVTWHYFQIMRTWRFETECSLRKESLLTNPRVNNEGGKQDPGKKL